MSQIIEAILRSGSKGTTGAADVTSSSIDSNTQALDVTLKGSPSVSVSNFPGSQAVTGPLTDSQLRASAVPVSGTFFQATQPVSGTFFQATQPVSGSVSVSNFPASQAVTGAFFQATQPVSAAALPLPNGAATSAKQDTGNTSIASVDTKTPALGQAAMAASSPVVIASNQSAVPVSGTFWQATQPVSGSVSVSNFPASQAVTGTFFQATQPVSIASMPSTPVTGTFFQATQPVSGSISVSNFPASQAVTGTFFQATQPVSGTVTATGPLTDTQLRASAVPVSGTFFQATQPVSGTVTSNLGTIPSLTKGTQGATGFSTQDLKDSGRNQTNYYMAIQIVSTNADALLSLTGYKSGALVNATTTPAVVTSGKTYRITSITLTYVTIVTTPGAIRFTLRANLSGVVAIGSPVVMNWTVGEPTGIAPVAGKFNTVTIPFPDGLEFAAGTGIGISQVGLNTVGTAAAVGYGIVTITGFEY